MTASMGLANIFGPVRKRPAARVVDRVRRAVELRDPFDHDPVAPRARNSRAHRNGRLDKIFSRDDPVEQTDP